MRSHSAVVLHQQLQIALVMLLPSVVTVSSLTWNVTMCNAACAEWGVCSAVFSTLDVAHLQHFAVYPPLECEAVKLVCIQNAAGLADERVGQYESIGFWEVRFG